MAGWFDSLAYKLSPLLGTVGKGIADNVQDSRMTDAVRAYQAAPDLASFRNIATPDDIYSPEHLKALELMKSLRQKDLMDQRDLLQKQAAAPVAQFVSGLKASGNDADPNFSGDEWVKGMATTPALGGFMSESDYNNARAGVMPGGKKGASPVSSYTANPEVAQLLSSAEQAAQNKGSMARVFNGGATSNPMDLATLAMNKDMSGGFDNVTQGTDRMFKQGETSRKQTANDALNQLVANFPLKQDLESWNSLSNQARNIPGVDLDSVTKTLNDIASRNTAPVKKIQMRVGNGPNSTVKDVWVDMFNRPVPNMNASSTNNPSDRELFGSAGGSGDSKPKNPQLYIIQKPDGRTVQVDATTEDGRNRLDIAISSGERVSKPGSVSASTTSINPDGSTSTQRTTGPTVFGVQTPAPKTPTVTVTRDKSGKLVIKR